MLNANSYLVQLKKNKMMVLNTVGICCAISLGSYFVLPKNYKVSTSIALQTQYFQLPLISGFMPETSDPAELRSKREALMHLALNQKFLGEIADKYKLVKDPSNSFEIELLSKKFEIIPSGPSSFVVSFSAKEPQLAYQVLQDFLAHLRNVMTEERKTLLLNLHDAIQEQLETISVGKQGETASAILASRPDLVQRQIIKIQNQIETLKSSYSETHPRIAALKEQLAQLSQYNSKSNGPESAPSMSTADVFTGAQVDPASKELFDDLIRKYRYLEVVIYMDQQNKDQYVSFLDEPYVPRSPTFPKLPLLMTWGIALGFLIGSVRVLLKALPRGLGKRFSVVSSESSAPRVRLSEEAMP
jgi:uncharacterized protein involved in exopolysaccharide biosynthesis